VSTETAPVAPVPRREDFGAVDVGTALLAGPAHWSDDLSSGARAHISALVLAIVVLVAVLSADGAVNRLALTVWTVSSAIGLGLLSRHAVPSGTLMAAVGRMLCIIGVSIGFVAMTPWTMLPVGWVLGIAFAADVQESYEAVGLDSEELASGRIALAPATIGAVVGVFLVIGWRGLSDGVLRYLAFWAGVVVMFAFAARFFVALARRRELDRSMLVELAAADVYRRQAAWLHDDVISAITGLQQSLERDGPSTIDGLRESLHKLEHGLRLQQSDQLGRSGRGRVKDIVQPYLRLVASRGATVVEPPTLETSSTVLSPDAAWLLRRSLGVLIPNALHAGAMHIRVGLTPPEHSPNGDLMVEVEDDAGGFDVEPLPAGRGLDTLSEDLGFGRLNLSRTASGTLASVRIAIRRSGDR
jgi:hypothetical protein